MVLHNTLVSAVTNTAGNLFVPYSDPVTLRVVNITQFTAQLEWNLPSETTSRLKALRVYTIDFSELKNLEVNF